MRPFITVLGFLLILSSGPVVAADWTMQLSVGNRVVQGKTLLANPKQVSLLLRDGEVFDFAPKEASGFQRVAEGFQSYSASEMRGRLMREFGQGFEVSGAGNHLVVHPAGQRDLWAARFDDMSPTFISYFSARSFRLESPPFPMVAVVFPNRSSFVRYAAKSGVRVSTGVLGFYSPTSNRILMYDTTAGRSTAQWRLNAETIIHEAVHQIAFNLGVHNRFAPQPRWLVEGLGMLFEAPGVSNARAYPLRTDRINRYRMNAYKQRAAKRSSESLAEMISDDRLFKSDPETAYAQAWALTFYLVENEPRKYSQLLALAAARPNFQAYTGAERLRDFQSIFGSNLLLLEARMTRFLDSVE